MCWGDTNADAAAASGAVPDETEGKGDEELEDIVGPTFNYAAWKTFPVRVNGIPVEVPAEELMEAFHRVRHVKEVVEGGKAESRSPLCAQVLTAAPASRPLFPLFPQYMPYDIDLLPPAAGASTRSAYLRFAKPQQAAACVEAMKGYTLAKHDLQVRGAYEKLFPVVVEGKAGAPAPSPADLANLLRGKDKSTGFTSPVEDPEVLGEKGGPLVFRFSHLRKARAAMETLKGQAGVSVRPGWKAFTLEVANLPADLTEDEFKDMVSLTKPYEWILEPGPGKSQRGRVSYFTKNEGQTAFEQLSGSPYQEIKMRKVSSLRSPRSLQKQCLPVRLLTSCLVLVVTRWHRADLGCLPSQGQGSFARHDGGGPEGVTAGERAFQGRLPAQPHRQAERRGGPALPHLRPAPGCHPQIPRQ